jgi:CheY-like chemotaxis protein
MWRKGCVVPNGDPGSFALTGAWETLHELKVSPATSRIPVLVVSPMEEQKMATAIGAAGSLMKPLSQPALIEAVRKTLHSESFFRDPAGKEGVDCG